MIEIEDKVLDRLSDYVDGRIDEVLDRLEDKIDTAIMDVINDNISFP